MSPWGHTVCLTTQSLQGETKTPRKSNQSEISPKAEPGPPDGSRAHVSVRPIVPHPLQHESCGVWMPIRTDQSPRSPSPFLAVSISSSVQRELSFISIEAEMEDRMHWQQPEGRPSLHTARWDGGGVISPFYRQRH